MTDAAPTGVTCATKESAPPGDGGKYKLAWMAAGVGVVRTTVVSAGAEVVVVVAGRMILWRAVRS